VGFAPASNPQIIVGSIMEFAEHGSSVAPYVIKVLRRFVLGPDTSRVAPPIRLVAPDDSAPRAVQLQPDTIPQVDPTPDDTIVPAPPPPTIE
jgi:hypothetical protein